MTEYVPTSMFWFTLACVNAGLAEQKGRSRLNWFFLSLLLGPFGTAYIVMTAPIEANSRVTGGQSPAAQTTDDQPVASAADAQTGA